MKPLEDIEVQEKLNAGSTVTSIWPSIPHRSLVPVGGPASHRLVERS